MTMIIQLSAQLYTYYTDEIDQNTSQPYQIFEPQEEEQIYSLQSLILEQSQNFIKILTSNSSSNTLTVNQDAYLNSLEQLANWTIDCQGQNFCTNILEQQTSDINKTLTVINTVLSNWQITTSPQIKLIFINCTLTNFTGNSEFLVEFYNSTITDSSIQILQNQSLFYNCLINSTTIQQFLVRINESQLINITAQQTEFLLNNTIITNSTLNQISINPQSYYGQINYNQIQLNQPLSVGTNNMLIGNMIKGNQIELTSTQYLFSGTYQNLTNFTFTTNEVKTNINQFYLIETVTTLTNVIIQNNILPQTQNFSLISQCYNSDNVILETNIHNQNIQEISVIRTIGNNVNTGQFQNVYIKLNYQILQMNNQSGIVSPFQSLQTINMNNVYLEENINFVYLDVQLGNSSSYLSLLTNNTQNSSLNGVYITGNVKVVNSNLNNNLYLTFLEFQNQANQQFVVDNVTFDLNILDIELVNNIWLTPNNNVSYQNSIFQVNNLYLIYENIPTSRNITQNVSYQQLYGLNISEITQGYTPQDVTPITVQKQQELQFQFQMEGTTTETIIDDHIQPRTINNTVIQVNGTFYGLCSYCHEFSENICQLSDTCTVNETQWLNMTSYTKQSCITGDQNISLDHINVCVMGVFQCEQGYGGQYCNYQLDTQEQDILDQIDNRTQDLQNERNTNLIETNNYYNQIVNELINITSYMGLDQPNTPEIQQPDFQNLTEPISMTQYIQNINDTLFQIAKNATRYFQNQSQLNSYTVQSLQQLQEELQELLTGLMRLAGDNYNQDDLSGTIQSILTDYQNIFQNILAICQQLDGFIFSGGDKEGIQQIIEDLYDQYYRAEFALELWQELYQNCTTYNQQHSIQGNTCEQYLNSEIIPNLQEIQNNATLLTQQLNEIINTINAERQRQQDLLAQQIYQEEQMFIIQGQIQQLQSQIEQGQSGYNQSKRKADISLYIMIAIIVITVIINVVLCVIYHCYPKYEENANIKRKLTQIEKGNQQNKSEDDSQTSQHKYRQVPKRLPQLKKNKKEETVIEETNKTINTVLSATQLTPQQKLKYAEEQLKLEKGKHEEIYQGEKIDVDKNIIGVLQRTQLQPSNVNNEQPNIQKIKKDIVL